MTLRERVVTVLEKWCGDEVLHSNWKLEDLWNATKETGNPSHSGIQFFPDGASDLVQRLIREYNRPDRPKKTINFNAQRLNPTGGTILTMEDLFQAVLRSPNVPAAPAVAALAVAPRVPRKRKPKPRSRR